MFCFLDLNTTRTRSWPAAKRIMERWGRARDSYVGARSERLIYHSSGKRERYIKTLLIWYQKQITVSISSGQLLTNTLVYKLTAVK